MTEFETWYQKSLENSFFEKYSFYDLLKLAFAAGAGSSADNVEVIPYLPEDEDLIISDELSDPLFFEKNPAAGEVELPPIEERLSEDELTQYKKLLEEKKSGNNV